MDDGKATGPQPKWWSRPRRHATTEPQPSAASAPPSAETPTEPQQPSAPAEPAEETAPQPTGQPDGASPGAAAPSPAQPLHGVDPYGTPPYGGPGPWALAPLVQHPSATPAHGVPLPPAVTPPHGTHLPSPGVTPAHGTHLAPSGVTPAHGTPAMGPAPAGPQPLAAPLPQQSGAPGVPPVPPAPLGQHAPQGPDSPQPHAPSAWLGHDPWAAPPAPPAGPRGGSRSGRTGRMISGAVLIALISGLVGGLLGAQLERDGGTGEVRLPQAPAEKQAHRSPGSVAGIAQRALPGVVTLHVSGGEGEATGTGFVLDKQGHILTNNHVVDAAADGGPIEVTFHDGQTAKGQVVGTDGGYDLAVVKVSGVSGLDPLPLGNSDSARVGDPVVAIGAPFDLDGTVTYGIVSATHRPITAGSDRSGGDTSYVDALQTDAPINPGNSGGPLVDSDGRVIGINSAIRAADSGSGLPGDGGEGGSIGLGFAIPVNQGKRVAEELINDGSATHPVIGVTLDMGYGGDGARVGDPRGGDAKPVLPGGPADKAGLKAHDVITAVDGDRVHSAEELIVKVRSHRPGDVLRLTLRRDGDKKTVRLTLGSAGGG